MKNFLKFSLLTAALVGCATFASAQITFGAKAGLNLANEIFSDEFEGADPKMLITFQVGGVVDIPISDMFSVQPALMLVGKGFKEEGEILGVTYESSSNPMYLQVPVMFMYHGDMFYAGVGPYAGFGLFGKAKAEAGGQSEEVDLSFGSSVEDNYSALDFGAQVEAGVALPMGLTIGAGYALGLANNLPADVQDVFDGSTKHSVISVNVGYMFGGGDE